MRLIILGAGGHGKVVADLAKQIGTYEQILFLDDHSLDSSVVGVCDDYLKFNAPDVEMYPAFGDNELRRQWAHRIEEAGIRLALLVHPRSYISPLAEIERGCVIMPYAVINTGCRIGKVCIINFHAVVDHDCILEEGCHIAPGGIVKAANHLPACTKVDSGEVISYQFHDRS